MMVLPYATVQALPILCNGRLRFGHSAGVLSSGGLMLRWKQRCADVPLPEGVQPPSDDQDDKDEAEPRKEPERWSDLGLHTVH